MDMVNKMDDELFSIINILGQLPTATVITNTDFEIIFINHKAEKLFGYSSDEIYGKNPIIFNAEPGAIDIQRDIEEKLSQGKCWSNRILNKRKNEELFVLDIDISAIRNKDGEIIAYIGLQKDATRAEEELVRERDTAQRYLDIAGVIIVVLDRKGKVTLINNKGCEVLGYGESEIVGKNWFSHFLPKDIQQDIEDYYEEIVNNNYGEYYKNVNDIITKSGELKTIEWIGTCFYDAYNNFSGVISSGTDITERKKTEFSLREIASESVRSNKELEDFAYVTSHDLQEPLRVVASYCQLLKEGYYPVLDKDGKKYVDYTISSALRMKTLIKELLDFSRVGRKDKPIEHLDVGKIIEEVIDDYQVSIDDNNAKIEVEKMPVILGISIRIKQLISNLISNALKFRSNKPPHIHIGCCDEGNSWLFYVKDNGIGIDSQYFERIFGLFKRLYSTDEYPGTGIGLALCRRIVETHGGKIWVDSEENKGTCIYFTIAKHLDISETLDI